MLKNGLLIIFIGLLSCNTYAQMNGFAGDGYYWYKDPLDEEKKPIDNQVPPKPSQPLSKEDVPLSAAWIIKNLETLRIRAIDDPTPENVSNYLYAQRVMIDKSQNFAVMHKQVVSSDPFLDEENRVPSSSYANTLFVKKVNKDKKEAIEFMSGKGGIWLFTDAPEKCSGCLTYKNDVIKTLVTKYKFNFKEIDVSTGKGLVAAKNLKLKLTPATVYVKPKDPLMPETESNKDETYVISEGLLSLSQVEDRLIIASNIGNLLPKELAERANPYQKGVLSKDDFAGIQIDDPSLVMKALRERIRSRDE